MPWRWIPTTRWDGPGSRSYGRPSPSSTAPRARRRRRRVLEPNLSRTQTVLGFAYLMRVKTRRAKEAFEKAIGLDQADPLPRLGLGLAKIREGKLHEGGREIEIAASLDPAQRHRPELSRQDLLRGEADRAGRARVRDGQAARSQRSDTLFLRRASRKQTTNRPVEALPRPAAGHRAERQPGRLPLPPAARCRRGRAQRQPGRVYSDLGFQQLALVEGWKSVNTDPTNFSAHRLAGRLATRSCRATRSPG